RPLVPRDEAGGALRAAVFDPLVPALRGHNRLILSPDGALAYLPFEVLPCGDGRRLIDDYRLSYLSCGRAALRLGLGPTGDPAPPLVRAAPASAPALAAAPAPTGDKSRRPRPGFWPRLLRRPATTVAAEPQPTPAATAALRAPGRRSR